MELPHLSTLSICELHQNIWFEFNPLHWDALQKLRSQNIRWLCVQERQESAILPGHNEMREHAALKNGVLILFAEARNAWNVEKISCSFEIARDRGLHTWSAIIWDRGEREPPAALLSAS